MITAKISISKSDVYKDVHELTAYIGAKKADDENAYDNIPVLDGEEYMLDPLYKDALCDIRQCLRRYLDEYTETNTGDAACVLLMPDNWLIVEDRTLKEYASGYVTDMVTSSWLATRSKDESEFYARKAVDGLNKLSIAVESRRRPKRKNKPGKMVIVSSVSVIKNEE